MSHPNCIYCHRDQRLDRLMIEIATLDDATLFLFRNQSYRGRVIVAHAQHVEEIFQLSREQRERFMESVAKTARALKVAFDAGKINYGIFGDTMPHLHVHLVPKLVHGPDWGKPFQMNPQPPKDLTDAGYESVAQAIRKHLV